MLVLSRKPGELINIGSNVEVTILKVRGQRVIVGLSAPADVSIRRQEVLARDVRNERAGIISRGESFGTVRHRRRLAGHVPHS